ncbi:uncharacterized protein LOC126859417 [Cataglyphis hispanica]|uniref:uncharacterized protein LOC126859417 n=1 Tax=Cataglyphis hispanica TaxID=1086592 RepID=UPI0021809622|nr:uncharacterized protein LOC126859417 [Cataglyphis hispanica]
MPSQRVKYALAHLSREEHTAQLARPNWRRLRKIDTNILVSPFTVRRAALRSRATKRIRIMAQPKFLTKKYDAAMAPPVSPRIHPKTLAAKSSRRIVDLALPKRRILLENVKLAATKTMRAAVGDLLGKVRKSRYQRYRVFCNARQEREARKKRRRMAKLRKALTKPEDWQRHMRVLERLAAPKIVVRPKKKPVRKMDPLTVSKRALAYRITKRIESLAVEKERPEIKLQIPGAVRPAAMKAIASQRVIALAKPAQRPAGMQTDLREDAFVVSPMALTARCSRRLKTLAKPRKYPTPVFKRLKTALRR